MRIWFHLIACLLCFISAAFAVWLIFASPYWAAFEFALVACGFWQARCIERMDHTRITETFR